MAHRKSAFIFMVLGLAGLAVFGYATTPGAAMPFSTSPETRVPATTTSTSVPPTTTTSTTLPPPTTTAAPAKTTSTTAAAHAVTTPPAPADPAVRAIPPRTVPSQKWTPFATVGGVTLHHPSAKVERVGFHESTNDGARDMEPLPSAVGPQILESRSRGTGPRTAADIVAQPNILIRAPVTGTVLRGGSYTLYCDNPDFYVVIEPDSRPGWEVKLLHMTGMYVRRGDRVEAGVTPIAPGPRILPFESQVDETTPIQPAWPHVHLEVVDPSIPDKPGHGGGC